jgi:cytoskeletal protein CcmA (bactofilin family)
MKRITIKIFSIFILIILVLGVLPVTAYAASPADIIIGNSYTLQSGNTLDDDLLILGGSVNLMVNSVVNGNIYLIGGSLQASGTVNGNINATGGSITLTATSVTIGNLTTAGVSVNRDPNAQITGVVRSETMGPSVVLPSGVQIPNMNVSFDPLFNLLSFILRIFLWALLAMVVAMFVPTQLARTAQTVISQPLISGGLGLLTVIVLPLLLVLLALTICLIPVTLVGALLLAIAWAFGLISLGTELGKRLSSIFKQEWHPAISAGLGTLLLILVLNSMEAVIPCIGWLPKALAGFVGLGAVLLTQFGTQAYNPHADISPVGTPTAPPVEVPPASEIPIPPPEG